MPMNNSSSRTVASISRRQRGVSLIEALVALVVLSVGLLGIAGLYLESVRSNRTALARTTAVFLVNDMADRIRSNRGGKTAYEVLPLGTAVADPGRDCATNNCTPAQMAAHDLRQWYLAVLDRLPKSPGNADPQISVDYVVGTSGDPDRYIITVAWVEPGNATPLTSQLEVLLLGSA
jgi:type IV pilus assembly protein PilV